MATQAAKLAAAHKAAVREGSERLLDAAGIPVDRLPMLNVVFDRMVTLCAESFRYLTSTPPMFTLKGIKSQRFAEILEPRADHVALAVFQAPAWDSRILVGVDHDLVFTFTEALFGGDGTEPAPGEDRALSNIELHVAQMVFEHLVKAMQSAFSSVVETSFRFERLETKVEFAGIAPRANFALLGALEMRMVDRTGELFVVIPQTALNSIRQSLGRDAASDAAKNDPRWSKQIRSEVSRTEVTVQAVIEETQFCLGDIADFHVGQILKLETTTRSRIKLESNAQPLFWCELGQVGGNYTLRIEDAFDQEQEFVDDLLPR